MLYLDNAATTPLHPLAFQAMTPYLTEHFANPSSVYRQAQKVRAAINNSRETIATSIGANAEEIFFTSSGTESDNWAIQGAIKKQGGHIITSSIEHHGIHHLCKFLETQGIDVTYLPVTSDGFVEPTAVESAIRPDTTLVSIMLANNEVGTIQPIAEIGEIVKKHKIIFHTDAVQAVGHIPIDVNMLGVDLLSLSAHKFYGPKGVGALYIRKGTKLDPMLHGGGHERNRRAGTENVAGIIGMGVALTETLKDLEAENNRILKIRNKLIDEILTNIPYTYLNGSSENRLPGNINISFDFIEGEALILHLDINGCQASTGSACSAISLEPSHVLMAMGLSHERTNGAVRFTLGKHNKEADVTNLLKILKPSVEKIRAMSPLYDDFLRSK